MPVPSMGDAPLDLLNSITTPRLRVSDDSKANISGRDEQGEEKQEN